MQIKGLRIEGFSDEEWHQIVKGVDLTLHRGEVLGLIGESGAGKSTIGIAAMGYAKPGCRINGGSIMFDGIDLIEVSEEERRKLRGSRIAYVAQSAAASFNPAHKLIDQFAETVIEHGVGTKETAYADAKDLYGKIRMPNPDEIGFRYPHQVSGGQLQRAMTAMALSCRPDLLIFDEPTTALDVTTQIEVLVTMRDIVEQFNCAAIYITHDLAVVAQMADKIMVLRYGETVEEADTRKMLSTPEQEYTKSLWAVRSFKKQEIAPPPEETPLIRVEKRDRRLRPGDGAVRGRVLRSIAATPWPWWASPAAAKAPPPGSLPVFCRRSKATCTMMACATRGITASATRSSCAKRR